MESDEAIRTLNELFAEEVEAAIRYLHLAVTLKGLDRLQVQPILLEGLRETLQHAQQVAECMVQHGGVPRLDLRISLEPELNSGEDALHTALDFEEAALEAYREALDKIGGDDIALEDFLRAQVAVESKHVADLKILLKD